MTETLVLLKRSPGSAAPTSLLFGEPAWVEATNTLYIGKSNGTVIGIPFGANYQPTNARLNEIAGLSPTNGAFLVGNGSSFVLQSGAGVRSLLGLGSAAIASTTDFVGSAEKGAVGGVATLDGTGKVPVSQLSPTYIPVLSVFGRIGPVIAQAGDYTAAQVGALAIANNLSDINNAAIARTNLGLGSAATASTAYLLDRANHTGTQAMSTIAGLQPALENKLSGSELDAHLSAPILDHPDGSVTDIKIGNRTVVDTSVPTSLGPGSLTQWLQWIINRIKVITDQPNWWDTPATTLRATATHIASTSNPHQLTAAQVGAIATTQLGVVNGVATLDGTGKVPTAQLPTLGAVQSVFGRTGSVTAQPGDYAAAQVGALATANNLSDLTNIRTARSNLRLTWIVKTSSYTAQPGDRIIANGSSAGFTVTLPTGATPGDEVQLLTIGTNSIAVDPAGANLNGAIAPLTIASDRQETHFIFIGAAGWVAAVGGGAASSSPSPSPTPTPTSPYGAEAQAVIDAILATGAALSEAEKLACSNRIKAMKDSGIWAKRIAYYGFLGKTAATNRINWKSPGTFNLSFQGGGWTHNNLGSQGNGSSSYADTGWIASVAGTLTNSFHLMMYCQTQNFKSVHDCGMGQGGDWLSMQIALNSGYANFDTPNSAGRITIISPANSRKIGYFLGSKVETEAFILLHNGSRPNANFAPASIAKFTRSLWLGSANFDTNDAGFSTQLFSSFAFGEGLTASQAYEDLEAEEAYQAALERRVLLP